jgi:O-antigen/teichoic acid export membrane protein
MSEVKRGFIRIASNYARLASTLLLGLVTVRVLLGTVGEDGYALVALAGATIGLGAMADGIVRGSLIRELGAVYHSGDAQAFARTYSSAFLLTLSGAAAGAMLYAAIFVALPYLGVPEAMLPAARVFVAAKALQSVLQIITAPTYNMYIITERMVQHNFWMVLDRASALAAALLLYIIPVESHDAVAVYGCLSAGIAILLNLLACALRIGSDGRLMPRPGLTRWRYARGMIHVGKWNALVLLSNNLHIRVNHLMLSIFLGLVPWNALFGFAVQLGGYIFQLGGGVAAGVEAVAARMSATGDVRMLRRLVYHSTRLHGLVAFPGLAVMFILAEPVLWVWVGDRMTNPDVMVPRAGTLLQILAVGFTVRALTSGWLAIFYGSGHVQAYALLLLVGGLANPLVAGLLLWLLPEPIRYTAVAWSFSGIFLLFTLVLAPLRAAPQMGLRPRDLYWPFVRPATAALVCSPILIAAAVYIDVWNLPRLVLVGGAYGGLYVLLAFFFVVNRSERRRFLAAAASRARPAQPAGEQPRA